MEQFHQDISVLNQATVSFAKNIITNKESATIFMGRATCPYCRLFASKLANVVKRTNATVYFINSEDLTQQDDLSAFRQTYGIKTVPGYIRIENGQVDVICDSSISEDTIQSFGKL